MLPLTLATLVQFTHTGVASVAACEDGTTEGSVAFGEAVVVAEPAFAEPEALGDAAVVGATVA